MIALEMYMLGGNIVMFFTYGCFKKQGESMLSAVLISNLAIEISIKIIELKLDIQEYNSQYSNIRDNKI